MHRFLCRSRIPVHVFVTSHKAIREAQDPGWKGIHTMDNDLNNENTATVNGRSTLRRFAIVAAGTGLGAVLVYLISKALGLRGKAEERLAPRHLPEHIVDDHGTGQEKAAKILRNLRDRAFEANDERLALALGRPVEEVAAWNAGMEIIDDDVVMKARG